MGQTLNKVWRDKNIQTPKHAFLAGLTYATGIPITIVHARGKEGYVDETKMLILAQKRILGYQALKQKALLSYKMIPTTRKN